MDININTINSMFAESTGCLSTMRSLIIAQGERIDSLMREIESLKDKINKEIVDADSELI